MVQLLVSTPFPWCSASCLPVAFSECCLRMQHGRCSVKPWRHAVRHGLTQALAMLHEQMMGDQATIRQLSVWSVIEMGQTGLALLSWWHPVASLRSVSLSMSRCTIQSNASVLLLDITLATNFLFRAVQVHDAAVSGSRPYRRPNDACGI